MIPRSTVRYTRIARRNSQAAAIFQVYTEKRKKTAFDFGKTVGLPTSM